LQVWLPDAMEGPSPVSALIHAATMVAAGIYMLCRIHVLMVPEALNVIAWVGTFTALYAAVCAIPQRDIKKVLAYSTVSQLGYMVAAFGLGRGGAGEGAAMFHLTTHAFFKALLFLGAGSVIYGCHHEQDIFKMGGLRSRMPLTFWTFTIGVAAIIGFPGLAGFFSKDAILALAFENNRAIFALLALTAVLTGFYMVRLWKIVFLGACQSDQAKHAHEGGIALVLPLLALAVLAVLGGYRGLYPHDVFAGVLAEVPEAEGSLQTFLLIASILIVIIGAGAALAFYRPPASGISEDSLERASPGLFGALVVWQQSFDRIYGYYVAKIQQRFAILLNYVDIVGISGIAVRGVAGIAEMAGMGARKVHTGRVSTYVYWFLAGVVVLWAFAAGILSLQR